MSADRPDTPSRPDSLYSMRSNAVGDMPCWRCRYSSTPGSIAPQRVPITSPSSAVRPIVVSMLTPSRIAHRLEPLPRCATTVRLAASFGEISARRWAMN